MSNIQAVSIEAHSQKRWLRFSHYGFTSRNSVCPIVIDELSKAMMSLPIAFVADNEEYSLAAVLGLSANENLVLDKEGLWLPSYIPARYRAYPFVLGKDEKDTTILCINNEEGVVVEQAQDKGEEFFDTEGKPSSALAEIVEFLKKIEASQNRTATICKLLQKFKLIQPWPISLAIEDSQRNVEGLFRVSESSFLELPPSSLAELRDAGALPLIYCQLLSMQHLKSLVERLSKKIDSQALPAELDLDQINDSGNIDFSNF